VSTMSDRYVTDEWPEIESTTSESCVPTSCDHYFASIRPSVVRFSSSVVGRKSRHQIDMVRAGATCFSDTVLFYLDAHDWNASTGN